MRNDLPPNPENPDRGYKHRERSSNLARVLRYMTLFGLSVSSVTQLACNTESPEVAEVRAEHDATKDAGDPDEHLTQSERFTLVLEDIREQLSENISNSEWEGENLNRKQKEILEAALAYPHAMHMSVAMTESKMDHFSYQDGMMQLTLAPIKDINRFFEDHAEKELIVDYDLNLEYSLLYLGLIRSQYVDTILKQQGVSETWSEEDRNILTAFFYNLGPGEGRKLIRSHKPENLQSFERIMAEEMGSRLGIQNPTVTETARDPRFGLEYEQSNAAKHYLRKRKKSIYSLRYYTNEEDDYPSVRKMGIALRYIDLVQTLTPILDDPIEGPKYLKLMGLN